MNTDLDALPIDRRVARTAAQWLMRLGADDVTADERQRCETWRAAHADHERAWQRAQQMSARLGLIPSAVGLPTLARSGVSRREAVKTLSLLIAATPAAWFALEATPWRAWSADHRTATGERRQLTLTDGTQLHLNTATSIDQRFDAHERLLVLRGGEVLIETAADPLRPLRVQTPQGLLRALGTRFTVREQAGFSRVAVLEGALELRPRASQAVAVLRAGQQARLRDAGIDAVTAVDSAATDWTRGLLRADRMPLGEFVAELSRYRSGWLRCDPAVAGLPISGLYQLGDPDAILRALPELLPVRLRQSTSYWVLIEPATV